MTTGKIETGGGAGASTFGTFGAFGIAGAATFGFGGGGGIFTGGALGAFTGGIFGIGGAANPPAAAGVAPSSSVSADDAISLSREMICV